MKLSISRIKLFKACRRAYELRYIEGLEPVEKAEALQTGTNYHELLEKLYNDGELPDCDYSKERAMAEAYKKYVYPQFKVKAAEQWINRGDFVGIADGIAENGWLVEHKTTSMDAFEYEAGLELDEQIPMYMWLTGARSMWYTVCRKPMIRQKKNELDEEFYQRMVEWYDDDTSSKIRAFPVMRTDEEIDTFERELKEIAFEISHARHENMYRNPCHCRAWGRTCEYAPICLHYDPNQEYIEFKKGEKNVKETDGQG